MKLKRLPARQSGFTLVEAIMVIVITGIVAGMAAMFIRLPVQAYIDSAARAELTDVADLALRRISREIRLALPNSIVVSTDGKTLQFILTKAGGRYVDISDDPPSTLQPLSWENSGTVFDIAGTAPIGRQSIVAGDRIVVNNLGVGMTPADAYSGNNVAVVSAISQNRVTLQANPFVNQSPPMGSPDFRFQVVTGMVDYACDPTTGKLNRYFSSAILGTGAQPTLPSNTPALLANLVSACSFQYNQVQNNIALVTLRLTLTQTNGESITLVRQVHVDNTP